MVNATPSGDLSDQERQQVDATVAEAHIRLNIMIDAVREHEREAGRCPGGCIGSEALGYMEQHEGADTELAILLIVALQRLARGEAA